MTTFVEKCLFNYQNPSFCVFVLINLRTALTWAETCSSIHVQVIIYNKACVVSDEKLSRVCVCVCACARVYVRFTVHNRPGKSNFIS